MKPRKKSDPIEMHSPIEKKGIQELNRKEKKRLIALAKRSKKR